jgi:hypothetical protein
LVASAATLILPFVLILAGTSAAIVLLVSALAAGVADGVVVGPSPR